MAAISVLDTVIGAEDPERLSTIASGRAPRLDYRLVAERYQVNIRQWHPPPSGMRGVRLVRVARSFFGNLCYAARLIRSLPSGAVVYATGETWGLPVGVTGMLQRQRRFKHVIYAHRVFSPAWLRFLRLTRHWLAVDGWICVNRRQAELLRATLGAGGKPIAVVSQGVDMSFFDPDKAQPPQGRPYILAVGAEMRNYALLFEAVRGLDVEVVVKASSAWMASGRSQLASIPPNVKVITERLSYVELRDLYAGAALVVVPLHETPQAAGITTILEGMAMSKCILATQSSGLPDGLLNGHNCVLVQSELQQLNHAITRLITDDGYRNTIACNGRRFVSENYTLEHHAQQISAFLDAVATSR